MNHDAPIDFAGPLAELAGAFASARSALKTDTNLKMSADYCSFLPRPQRPGEATAALKAAIGALQYERINDSAKK